jgi:plastocyanin
MVRRTIAVAGVAVLLGAVIALPHAAASGGGACPPPITNGRVTTVTIRNFCFGPTVVHVQPGDSVSWINRDSTEHTVTGANRAFGSYRSLRRGHPVAWQFERAGVYPYYCALHLGMVGAVVVGGDGELAAAGDIGRGDVKRVRVLDPSSASLPPAPRVPSATEPNPSLAVAAGTGIALVGIVAARIRRRTVRRAR